MKLAAAVTLSLLVATSELAAGSGRDAGAAFPGRNGRVAAQVTAPGGSELSPAAIYLFYPDERSSVVVLTPDDGSHNANPAWSPTGDRVAFNSNAGGLSEGDFDIVVVRDDGSARMRATSAARAQVDPAWAPSGRTIAYASDETGDSEIWSVDVPGGAPRRLTTNPAFDGEPAWSPGGGEIAFTSRRDGNQELYVMNADGSNVRRLTTSPGSDRHPAWSPDGARIAFDSDRSGNFEIYTLARDGSDVRRLTSDPALDARPAWSPTGDSITFQSDRQARNGRHLWIVRSSGGAPVQLSAGSGWVTSPDWQAIESEGPCTIKGTIHGDRALIGTSRADVICGLAGADALDGGGGPDRLDGGPGEDRVNGGNGADRVRSGAGNDRIIDFSGRDRLEGGAGNDVFSARDGRRDTVLGGPGRDSAVVDRIDSVVGVERVARR